MANSDGNSASASGCGVCCANATQHKIHSDKIDKQGVFILHLEQKTGIHTSGSQKARKQNEIFMIPGFRESISSFPAFLIHFSDSLDPRWNLRRTPCFSAPIQRRGSLRSSWARLARSKFIDGKRMARQLSKLNRSTRSFGPIVTLSILASMPRSSGAISNTGGVSRLIAGRN